MRTHAYPATGQFRNLEAWFPFPPWDSSAGSVLTSELLVELAGSFVVTASQTIFLFAKYYLLQPSTSDDIKNNS